MSNVELIRQGYRHFAAGEIQAAASAFAADAEWNQCRGFPYISGDGRFIGPRAIIEGVFVHIPQHYDDFHIDIQELFECGDRVVMVGYYTGVWKKTGKRFRANATHIWTVSEGRVTRLFQAVDTVEIIGAPD